MNKQGYEYLAREVNQIEIDQRINDGYVNATALCKASGKLIADYLRLDSTKEFLTELESDVGNPISELVQVVKGGNPQLQGTWVHPYVAINLGQWLSPKFAVQVSKWVFEWMNNDHRYYARYQQLMKVKDEKIEQASEYGKGLNAWKHEKKAIEQEEAFLIDKIQVDMFRVH